MHCPVCFIFLQYEFQAGIDFYSDFYWLNVILLYCYNWNTITCIIPVLIEHLFSLWGVWIIEDTAAWFTLGYTQQPAPAIVKPWLQFFMVTFLGSELKFSKTTCSVSTSLSKLCTSLKQFLILPNKLIMLRNIQANDCVQLSVVSYIISCLCHVDQSITLVLRWIV